MQTTFFRFSVLFLSVFFITSHAGDHQHPSVLQIVQHALTPKGSPSTERKVTPAPSPTDSAQVHMEEHAPSVMRTMQDINTKLVKIEVTLDKAAKEEEAYKSVLEERVTQLDTQYGLLGADKKGNIPAEKIMTTVAGSTDSVALTRVLDGRIAALDTRLKRLEADDAQSKVRRAERGWFLSNLDKGLAILALAKVVTYAGTAMQFAAPYGAQLGSVATVGLNYLPWVGLSLGVAAVLADTSIRASATGLDALRQPWQEYLTKKGWKNSKPSNAFLRVVAFGNAVGHTAISIGKEAVQMAVTLGTAPLIAGMIAVLATSGGQKMPLLVAK